MSSDTLVTSSAAPGIPQHADTLRIVPQRRYGQWAAAVVVLVPLGLGTLPAGNMLISALKGTSIVSVIAVNVLLFSVRLVNHQTYLGLAQHYARGTGATR